VTSNPEVFPLIQVIYRAQKEVAADPAPLAKVIKDRLNVLARIDPAATEAMLNEL
jgi:hypothetical protein